MASNLNAERTRKVQLERFEKFISKEAWTDINLYSQLYKERQDGTPVVQLTVYSLPSVDPNNTDAVKFEDATKDLSLYAPAAVGQVFGPSWSTHWFKGIIRLISSKLIN